VKRETRGRDGEFLNVNCKREKLERGRKRKRAQERRYHFV
jgi:hypothetical protein